MKAVILAAGEGKRLKPLTNTIPKCLLRYKDETILERIIRQIKNQEIDEIIVVVGHLKDKIIKRIENIDGIKIVINERYKDDVNIYSMLLAVEDVEDEIIIFEADMIAEDGFVKYVSGTDFEGKSVWFTKGHFTKDQNGGILKTDGKNNVTDIKIVKKYDEKYKDYYKLTGVMRVNLKELKKFKKLLKEYSLISLKQYYLTPWIENLKGFPCEYGDASSYRYITFNTIEEYKKINDTKFDGEVEEKKVYLIKVDKLYPIEDYDKKRLPLVKSAIIKNDYWWHPLRIEKNYNLILDGHHSYEIAKGMKLKYVPVIGFNYNELTIWSLREEISLTKEKVIKNAINNKKYPYKTVKHKFPNIKYHCKINLSELR
jgi:choline kinase